MCATVRKREMRGVAGVPHVAGVGEKRPLGKVWETLYCQWRAPQQGGLLVLCTLACVRGGGQGGFSVLGRDWGWPSCIKLAQAAAVTDVLLFMGWFMGHCSNQLSHTSQGCSFV